MGSATLRALALVITPQGFGPADLPTRPPYTLEPPIPAGGWHTLLRHPIASPGGTGILTRFPSATPLGLALGAD